MQCTYLTHYSRFKEKPFTNDLVGSSKNIMFVNLNMYVVLQSPPSITCHQRNGEDQTGEEASAAAPAAPKASCQATVFAAEAQHT